MRNLITQGGGSPIKVKAAAARTSGVPCIEAGFHGIPYVSAIIGQLYRLDTRIGGEFFFPLLASSAVGDTVYLNETTFALTRAARGTAAAGGTRVFGSVTAIPSDPYPVGQGPNTGEMWVRVAGQPS